MTLREELENLYSTDCETIVIIRDKREEFKGTVSCLKETRDDLLDSQIKGNLEFIVGLGYKGEIACDKSPFELFGNSTIKKFTGDDEVVIIPDGIEVIGAGAFKGCQSIKKLIITKTVRRIENEAFANCRNLECIEFRDIDYLEMGDKCFGCELLEGHSISDKCNDSDFDTVGVKNIYWGVKKCTMIKTGLGIVDALSHPFSDRYVCGGMFHSTKKVVLGDNVEVIPHHFFSSFYCLNTITIPYSVKTIEAQGLDTDSKIEGVVMENPYGWVACLDGARYASISADTMSDPKKAAEVFYKEYVKYTRPHSWLTEISVTSFFSFERR